MILFRHRSRRAFGIAVAAVAVVATGASHAGVDAQGRVRRVMTAVSVGSPGIPSVDSAATAAAFIRGLLADSLIEIANRPGPRGRPLRATRFLVSVTARTRDSVIRYDVRAFDSATRSVALRDSLWTFGSAAPDSLFVAARRMARKIATLAG